MLVPISWLREVVELPEDLTARQVAEGLIRVGLEVEGVQSTGADVTGPLVVGRVLSFDDEPQKNGKTIRWCQVDVGEPGGHRGIVCGALNFAVDDLVVVALPGAVLPGDFAISARKTYGHVSDGMICSERELGLGDDHSGIMVLGPDEGTPGDDATPILYLREDVLDIAVTPDRGYALSIRGVAREAAAAFGVPFTDPVGDRLSAQPETFGEPYPVVLDDPGCPAFAAVSVNGFDPSRPSPRWLRRRVQLAGSRPISLAVDVTNYVMYELGEPIHGYDADKVSGPIRVRAAEPGEKLATLDGTARELDVDDILITDDSGPIGLAGVMGGATTELGADSSRIVVEAAWFDPARIARTSRRHKLSTEASRRFERGVDSRLQHAAATRVATLLAELGGGTVTSSALAGGTTPPPVVEFAGDHAAKVAGYPIDPETAAARLRDVGCVVESVGSASPARGDEAVADVLSVTPPTWRPDLTDPNDFAEEVIRLEGYDRVPSVLPVAPPGRGWTAEQRLRRAIGHGLAGHGFAEVLAYPFIGEEDFDRLRLPAGDRRRVALRLANPISESEPLMRTTLLPGLLTTARRNVGRGLSDLALYEVGLVFRPDVDAEPVTAPIPPVDRRPTEAEIEALDRALPAQPHRVAVVACGEWESSGWWGSARPVSWADAVEAARVVARIARVELAVEPDDHAPWHPGRCARLTVDGRLVGHAGELHPAVCTTYGLPPRTVAMELEVERLQMAEGPISAPVFSTFPVAKEDVALEVAADVPAADVQAALVDGAGELLESVRLFDVYTGEQVGSGRKSLAYALRFRAPDRTLTEAEVAEAKQAAVDEAARRVGAVQRGA